MNNTETELKDILIEIRGVAKTVNDIDKRLVAVETKIDNLDKRFDGLETRLIDNEKRFWTLVVGVVLALFGLLTKLAFFPKI